MTAAHPVEEFLSLGLLPIPDKADSKVLEVPYTELISSVISQLHQRRLVACVVSLASGQKEIFDCMDFLSYLLEAVFGGSPDGPEVWETTKRKLRRVAGEPVRKALRCRRNSTTSGGSGSGERGALGFVNFDSCKSLDELLQLLQTQRIVPVYRGKELCRFVMAQDVLELCLRTSEEQKEQLDLHFNELIIKSPSMISKHEIIDDQSTLEAMRQMREADTHVMPIMALSIDHVVSSMSLETKDSSDAHRRVSGQFDVCSLRVIFARSAEDEPKSPWWWEEESITTSIFQESCMDFVTMGPKVLTSEAPPYAAVLSEEPLTRAISRALASSYQSVVVYRVEPGRGVIAKPVAAKPFEGVATTHGIVMAMIEVGMFSVLAFDPNKPRRSSERRRPTLTPADVQAVLASNAEPDRRSKVTFNNVIALEQLSVPTCPEHGAHYMRFAKDDVNSAMDFTALKDWAPEAKVLGLMASCNACNRKLGQVTKLEPVRAVPRLQRSSGSKDSDPDPAKTAPRVSKKGSAKNVNGSKDGKVRRLDSGSDGSQVSFFGFCCIAHCQQVSSKDQIHADTSSTSSGQKPQREAVTDGARSPSAPRSSKEPAR